MIESIPVTIYHNPACGTSRNVLALIRNAGVEPLRQSVLQLTAIGRNLNQIAQATTDSGCRAGEPRMGPGHHSLTHAHV